MDPKTAKRKKSPRNSIWLKGEFGRASACRRTRRSAGGQEADPTRFHHVGRMPSQDVWSVERPLKSGGIAGRAPRSVIRMSRLVLGITRRIEKPVAAMQALLRSMHGGDWRLEWCQTAPWRGVWHFGPGRCGERHILAVLAEAPDGYTVRQFYPDSSIPPFMSTVRGETLGMAVFPNAPWRRGQIPCLFSITPLPPPNDWPKLPSTSSKPSR